MGFKCGIVGLPNVGKSTLFNALTTAGAQVANFPFCTIEPNVGVVPVPDERLNKIASVFQPEKITPTSMEFVDIAGLVRGASQGEGLGNQFLAHIREVDAIAHVVRCFPESDVAHVEGSVDPVRDIETIETELCLADLDTASRALERSTKNSKAGDKQTLLRKSVTEAMHTHLSAGHPARSLALSDEARPVVNELHLLTSKPMLIVCNVGEQDPLKESPDAEKVRGLGRVREIPVVEISARMEAEIAELPPQDRKIFLDELGSSDSGLGRLIRAGYDLLGLITYFTAGEKECRAWTIPRNTKAPQAAGKIHSDFERGFICAEVYHYNDLLKCGTEAAIKSEGLLRVEGKQYVMSDGDICHFRFNV